MWLDQVPAPVTQAYIRMVPRLEAEAAVRASNAAAMGSGMLKPEDAAQMRASLQEAMGPTARRERKADPGRLAVKGFAVRKVVTDRARAKRAQA